MADLITELPPEETIHNPKGEIAIARVLRVGAFLSTLIMLAGVLLLVFRGRASDAAGVHFVTLRELLPKLVRLNPEAVTELGVLLLLMTPVARIVISVIGFAMERDLKYVLISLAVLGIVLFSIAFAIKV
ncbi:MAG: DUF1634 domain-containing protein [Deltaproteobacteria bacterium]